MRPFRIENFTKIIRPKEDNLLDERSMSMTSLGNSPNKKSLVNYKRADMDNFIKGISDYKVAYTPYFGHSTLHFGHKQFNAWKELSLNIINIGAPKHSAILEMVQHHYHKEKLSQELQKKS